ncbi:30142_t:CDS:1, partial [Racocetra persica]
NSFNSPSVSGTFSFRLESNNSIIPPPDPFLRIADLEYQLFLHIQEIQQVSGPILPEEFLSDGNS